MNVTAKESKAVAHRWLRNGEAVSIGWLSGLPSERSFQSQRECNELPDVEWTVEYAIPESALHAAEAENQRLTVENRIKSRAVDRWVPCPDHRDKVDGNGCYVCRNEKLKAELGELRRRVGVMAEIIGGSLGRGAMVMTRRRWANELKLLASDGGADGVSK